MSIEHLGEVLLRHIIAGTAQQYKTERLSTGGKGSAFHSLNRSDTRSKPRLCVDSAQFLRWLWRVTDLETGVWIMQHSYDARNCCDS